MTVRSIARIATLFLALAVLAGLVYAAQRRSRPDPVERADLLPSTKADAGAAARARFQEDALLPSTRQGTISDPPGLIRKKPAP